MDNSWIDEKERANRAFGYAALAITGRTDKASLDYFADTSADKNLPPLAAAQIALAFAKNNNADKANFWLAK
ncbi:hypothetical protein ACSLVQ_29245, partial [Klebsiella pneumoniae]|uniref:hypothetical protein n=1 Tax=Klebsiella pneumoniae TaxID=573 RepID=UPI003EE1F5B1